MQRRSVKITLHIKNLGNQTQQELAFDHLPLLFGRSKICDVVLSDPTLSRQQCSLEIKDVTAQGPRLRLSDLDSANGTFFEGKAIKDQMIDAGQTFRMGDVEVKIARLDLSEEALIEQSVVLTDRLTQKTESHAAATQAKGTAKTEDAFTSSQELTMKTPTVLRKKQVAPSFKTKNWVQVSLLWKGAIVDISCFDIGQVVTLGASPSNDFVVNVPALPDRFELIKILPNGVEIHLHSAMKGMVETRGSVRSLEELRATARQIDIGLSTFVQFSDRCLIEIGPFAVFIQSVRLNLTAPLTAPLIREPLFAGILSVFVVAFGMLLVTMRSLPSAPVPELSQKLPPVVQLEDMMPETKAPEPAPLPPPPPPEPPKPVKVGDEATRKMRMSGKEGEGAKAAGEEGKAGRTTGTIKTRTRPIGIISQKPPVRQAPAGALGQVKEKSLAQKGLRPDQGVGTGKPKPAGTGVQAPSKAIAPQVKAEDLGVAGALAQNGGGGSARRGGVLEGRGLGGDCCFN